MNGHRDWDWDRNRVGTCATMNVCATYSVHTAILTDTITISKMLWNMSHWATWAREWVVRWSLLYIDMCWMWFEWQMLLNRWKLFCWTMVVNALVSFASPGSSILCCRLIGMYFIQLLLFVFVFNKKQKQFKSTSILLFLLMLTYALVLRTRTANDYNNNNLV